jgi:ABC-type Fe3+-citrate transport system substrate-binding protein
MLSKMADKSTRKTIKSLEKKIAKHEKSLADPAQKLSKKHHEHELRVFKEQHKLATKEASKRGLIGILPFIGSLLDPFDAISGELTSDEEYLQQYYENKQNPCK